MTQTQRRIISAAIPGIKKVIVHPEMYNGKGNCIAVMTQERLLRLLKQYPRLTFDYVIIDEAHNLLKSDSRTTLLASTLILLNKRNPEVKFKFLTPFVSSPQNLKVRYTEYDTNDYVISEYVKSERYYHVDRSSNLKLYDQFFRSFYLVNKATTVQNNFQE